MKDTINLRTDSQWPCGESIVMIRTMTDTEMQKEGWDSFYYERINPTCLVLSDGSVLYPSRDFEGNGPGQFFGNKDKNSFVITLSEA